MTEDDIERRIADVSMTLAACLKQNDAFHVVLGALRHAGARMGAVCMVDPAVRGALVVRLSFGMEGASNKVLRPSSPRRKTAADKAMETGRTVDADYALGGLSPTDLEEKLGVDRAVLVPVAGPDRPLGLILAVPGPAEDDDVPALAARLAAVLAQHLDHLNPMPAPPTPPPALVGDSDSFIVALAEIAGMTDIDELSERVLDHCRRFTGSRFGFVGYVDPATGFLLTPTMTRDIFHQCQVAGKTVVFEKPGGLGGVVFDSDRPLIANDPAGHPSSVGTPPGHLPIRRFMGVPCLHGGGKRGMIGLANKEGDYTTNDLELVNALGAVYAAQVARWYAERELAEERDRTAALLSRAPCGFVVADAEGRVISVNGSLLARLDPALAEPGRDLTLADLIHPASQGTLDMQLAAARDGQDGTVEIDYLGPGGTPLRASQSVAAETDPRGFVRHYQVVASFPA